MEIYSSLGCPGPVSYVSYLAYQTCQLPIWNGLSLSWDSLCMPCMRTSFRFYLGRFWRFEPTVAWGCAISLKAVEQNNPQHKNWVKFIQWLLTTIAWETTFYKALKNFRRGKGDRQYICDSGKKGTCNQAHISGEGCCWLWGTGILVNGLSVFLSMRRCKKPGS